MKQKFYRPVELPEQPLTPRVETGGVRFGDDWPGYFMRGDNAIYLATTIQALADSLRKRRLKGGERIMLSVIEALANDIMEDVPMAQWKKVPKEEEPHV